MIRQMKSYFNKDDVDYTLGYVDPFKYHSTFYYFLNSFHVGVDRPSGIKAYCNQNLVLLFLGTVSGVICFISFIHGVNTLNLYHVTETASYVILLVYKVLILSCTKTNYKEYQSLLRAMKEDFQYICMNPSGQKYRERFFDNQLLTWKVTIISVVFSTAVPMGMVSFAIIMLVAFLVTHEPGDGGKRPLLFPFWMKDVDFGATPTYEIAFMFSNITACGYAYNYIFMIQTAIVWVRHIATKVDMIIWSIEDLFVDVHPTTNCKEMEHFKRVIKHRMRHVVRQHQSMYSLMDDWVKVYKKSLLYEQKVSTMLVCLTAYCTAEKLDQGELQLILVLICIATVVLHFIPCFLCTYIANKIHSVCDACWNAPFWNASKVVRSYFVLIMQRSMRPLPLQAAGFDEISLKTFSIKMSNAYTVFNMLRQTNK